MNKIILQKMSVLSFILGMAGGLLTIVPIVGVIVFVAMLTVASVVILLYMKRNNMIGLFEAKQAALYGAIIGFVSFIGCSVTMVPVAGLLGWINSVWFHKLAWFSIIKVLFTMGFSGIGMLFMLLFFIAALSAIVNAFSGMVAIAAIQEFEGTEKKKDDFKVDIEIK